MNLVTKQIENESEKQDVARKILESLPEWFAILDSREEYIHKSKEQICIAAYNDDKQPVGFLCLKETGKDTVEIAVMGVLKEYHRKGIGGKLFQLSKEIVADNGYSFMQVKTVQMGKYPDYDQTNKFYLSLGFKEFEVIPLLWDEWNPCQVYVMSL